MPETHDLQQPDASWDARIAAFWGSVDEEQPDAAWEHLEPLLAERPDGDAASAFERASLHDLLGEEEAAIRHYRAALAVGLDSERQGYAVIQLASTLRNVGRAEEAAALLQTLRDDERLGGAARAFLALAFHDLGRPDEALSLVLTDLAETLPLYGRALGEYATLLLDNETGP